MRALRFYEFGGVEVLKLDRDVPIPEPGAGELLIRVAGAGLNPVDLKIMSGGMGPIPLPITVGREFSGTIEKLGPEVEEFAVGEEVYGMAPYSCADYVTVKAETVAYRPPSMDLSDSGGVALAAETAWQAVFDNGQLQSGQKVLIQAAAGGVGSFAVQMAKWKGAYVAGTSSPRNFHLLGELGVDLPIDYKSTPYQGILSEYDLVIESVSPKNFSNSLSILKQGGTLVSLIGPGAEEEAAAQGKTAIAMHAVPKRSQLEEISALIEDLKIRPVIDTVVPFEKSIELYKELATGHTVGKLVVNMLA